MDIESFFNTYGELELVRQEREENKKNNKSPIDDDEGGPRTKKPNVMKVKRNNRGGKGDDYQTKQLAKTFQEPNADNDTYYSE